MVGIALLLRLNWAVVARLADGHQVGLRPEQMRVAAMPDLVMDNQLAGVVGDQTAALPLAGEQVAGGEF